MRTIPRDIQDIIQTATNRYRPGASRLSNQQIELLRNLTNLIKNPNSPLGLRRFNYGFLFRTLLKLFFQSQPNEAKKFIQDNCQEDNDASLLFKVWALQADPTNENQAILNAINTAIDFGHPYAPFMLATYHVHHTDGDQRFQVAADIYLELLKKDPNDETALFSLAALIYNYPEKITLPETESPPLFEIIQNSKQRSGRAYLADNEEGKDTLKQLVLTLSLSDNPIATRISVNDLDNIQTSDIEEFNKLVFTPEERKTIVDLTSGKITPQEEKAVMVLLLLEKAALLNSPEASQLLGSLYYDGFPKGGISPNYVKAKKHLDNAKGFSDNTLNPFAGPGCPWEDPFLKCKLEMLALQKQISSQHSLEEEEEQKENEQLHKESEEAIRSGSVAYPAAMLRRAKKLPSSSLNPDEEEAATKSLCQSMLLGHLPALLYAIEFDETNAAENKPCFFTETEREAILQYLRSQNYFPAIQKSPDAALSKIKQIGSQKDFQKLNALVTSYLSFRPSGKAANAEAANAEAANAEAANAFYTKLFDALSTMLKTLEQKEISTSSGSFYTIASSINSFLRRNKESESIFRELIKVHAEKRKDSVLQSMSRKNRMMRDKIKLDNIESFDDLLAFFCGQFHIPLSSSQPGLPSQTGLFTSASAPASAPASASASAPAPASASASAPAPSTST